MIELKNVDVLREIGVSETIISYWNDHDIDIGEDIAYIICNNEELEDPLKKYFIKRSGIDKEYDIDSMNVFKYFDHPFKQGDIVKKKDYDGNIIYGIVFRTITEDIYKDMLDYIDFSDYQIPVQWFYNVDKSFYHTHDCPLYLSYPDESDKESKDYDYVYRMLQFMTFKEYYEFLFNQGE